MNQLECRREALMSHLAEHAGAARSRLRLSLADAARLTGIAPELITAIENGSDSTSSLATLAQLAQFLGLTEAGLPRCRPPGMNR